MLSMHAGDDMIGRAMDLGANAYVPKNSTPDEIEDAIRGVATNGYHFSDRVSNVMLHGLVNSKKIKPEYEVTEPLTERELEVLRAICQELTTTEIAGQLFLSPRTVEGHRNKILQKTRARNTAGLVVFALTKGRAWSWTYCKTAPVSCGSPPRTG